jgi:hypothetical protein
LKDLVEPLEKASMRCSSLAGMGGLSFIGWA